MSEHQSAITRTELLEALIKLGAPDRSDTERDHVQADTLLLRYIEDHDVWAAYSRIKRRYS